MSRVFRARCRKLASLRCAVVPLLVVGLLVSAPAQVASDSAELSDYTVILQSPSVGGRMSSARAKSAHGSPRRMNASSPAYLRREVANTQQPVRQALESMGVQVLGSVDSVLNAIFVRATQEQVQAIARIAEVRQVARSRRYAPMLDGVSRMVRVSAARIRAGSQLLGDGQKIAIIDSGIDPEHEAFQDESLGALPGYPNGPPEDLEFTNTKIVAARSYVHLLNSGGLFESSPDDLSVRDLLGHGTAVAMIAAGRRIETPAGTLSGIAPRARLGVYKVFGAPGINGYAKDSALISAVNDAVADDMDILNLSLGNIPFFAWDAAGADCGIADPNEPCDPVTAAIQSAVLDFDRVVVVAAGNAGLAGTHHFPALTTIASPGHAPAAIAVGATTNSKSVHHSVHVADSSFDALSGTGPAPDGPLTAPTKLASDFEDSKGCVPYPEGALAGTIVVADRGECWFLVKVEHADAAGAVGVLVINHEGDDSLVGMAVLQTTDIPAYLVGASDGATLRDLLADPANLLTLDPTLKVAPRDWPLVHVASSRGPSLTLDPKPDLVAPGVQVYTAAAHYDVQGNLLNPSGFREESGTSLAAPVVAGAAALILQANPEMSARAVASALMNTADPDIHEAGEPARLSSVGAGLLDVRRALQAPATAVPPSIGFGPMRDAVLPLRRTLRVTNRMPRTQSFLIRVEPRDEDSNARITINSRPARVFRLEAGASEELQIALEGSRPLPGSYEGRLRLTSLNRGSHLLVPYLYVVPDNEPFNAAVIVGGIEIGPAGENAEKSVVALVVDRFGAPAANLPVQFRIEAGSGRILSSVETSTESGLIYGRVGYGPEPDLQEVVASIGGIEVHFFFQAVGARPEVLSIANSASLISSQALAPGSLAAITGTGFAEFEGTLAELPQSRPLPVSRKGVTVAFDAPQERVSVAGRIYQVSQDRLTVHVPWELASLEQAYVKVKAAEHSEPFMFQLAEVAPGVFWYESDGLHRVVAQHADGSPITRGQPAQRGETITIVMTGNGPVNSPPPTGAVGSLLNTTLYQPIVRIDGVAAEITYSGLSQELAGVYLVSLVVPPDVGAGEATLQVEIQGTKSNIVRLPVQ